MTWPAVVIWIVCAAGLVARGPLLVYTFFVSIGFGTLLMLPIEVNVLPQIVTAGFLALKVLSRPGNLTRLLETAILPDRAGLFSLFVLYALLTTFILPRLYAGQIEVVPISGALTGATLLAPTSGNISQACYLLAAYCTTLVFAILTSQAAFYRNVLMASVALGLTLVVTGLIDYLSYYGGAGDLLGPFRNASYNLLTDVEAAGTKRVVGLMSEASAYGSTCVSVAAALTFLRPCYEARSMRIVVGLTALGLVAMAALSTSTSAYVGLGVFGVVYVVNWLVRFNARRAWTPDSLLWELGVILTLGLALCSAVALVPQLRDQAVRLATVIVVEKDMSASYFERSMWTRIGWEAFVASGGLGVGYGSVRVSNWFVAIASSTGLLGALLLFGFLVFLLLRPVHTRDRVKRETIRALRLSLIPTSVMYWFGGAIPDIGVWIACSFGVLIALMARSEPTTVMAASGMSSDVRGAMRRGS